MTQERPILVVANGDVDDEIWVATRVKQAAIVIAVDGGVRHLFAVGKVPDVVVGDMDSTPGHIKQWLLQHAVEQLAYSAEKDETDLELALQYVTANYKNSIHIIAATGGRTDHMLANMLLLANARWRGRSIVILSKQQRIFLIEESAEVVATAGDLVSLLPLGGDVQVAHTQGLAWPLSQETLYFGEPRGMSNVMTADKANVALKAGCLICVVTTQDWQR